MLCSILSYYSLFLHFVPAAKTQEVKVASAASFHGQGLFSFPKRKFCPFLGGGGGREERGGEGLSPPSSPTCFLFHFSPSSSSFADGKSRNPITSKSIPLHPSMPRRWVESSLWVGYVGGLSPRLPHPLAAARKIIGTRMKDKWGSDGGREKMCTGAAKGRGFAKSSIIVERV